jgi:uncharacterized phage protein (TIGR01671 family)
MNREIKFEYGFQSVNGIVKKVYHLHEIPNIKEKCDIWNVLPIVYVRQFTGLHDKNNKEVFEGDVLKITLEGMGFWEKQKDLERIGEVIYESDYGGFIVMWEYSKNQHHENLGCDIALTSEILGNIYENPELL